MSNLNSSVTDISITLNGETITWKGETDNPQEVIVLLMALFNKTEQPVKTEQPKTILDKVKIQEIRDRLKEEILREKSREKPVISGILSTGSPTIKRPTWAISNSRTTTVSSGNPATTGTVMYDPSNPDNPPTTFTL